MARRSSRPTSASSARCSRPARSSVGHSMSDDHAGLPRSAHRPLEMISARGLTKNFGGLTAVDHLNLEIAPGEFFAFLGPNAAGKTTTIKMLSGLLCPSSGEVY